MRLRFANVKLVTGCLTDHGSLNECHESLTIDWERPELDETWKFTSLVILVFVPVESQRTIQRQYLHAQFEDGDQHGIVHLSLLL